jgi:exodeoxyribonuclease V beta subunit
MKPKMLDPLKIELDGSNLIEASAGTGKTHNITTLYLRLIVEVGLQVGEILVVTFTEAATAELRDRLRGKLRQALDRLDGKPCEDQQLKAIIENRKDAREKLRLAMRSFDEAAISTIHGFCNRMLHENAFESGVLFDTELLTAERHLLGQILADYWALEVCRAHPLFVRHLRYKNYTPGALKELISKTIAQPDRIIVPDSVDPVHPEIQYDQAYQDARDIWKKHQDEITDRLEAAYPGLNKRSYKIEDLPKYLERADADLESQEPVLPGEAPWIEKFSAKKLKASTKKNQKTPEHDFFDACQALGDFVPLFDGKELGFLLGLVTYAREQLRLRKEEMNKQSYDDMLTRLHDALGGSGDTPLVKIIRRKYRAALIDEFQDTDTIQYKIFTRLFSDHATPMFQIGDPKQSIFRFRGADIFSYLKAAKRADRCYTLNTNWRSDPKLIAGINFLFDRLAKRGAPFLCDDISYHDVNHREGARDALTVDGRAVVPIEIRFIPTEGRGRHGVKVSWAHENMADLVAADIVDLLKSKPVIEIEKDGEAEKRELVAGDIAVLVKKHEQARKIQDALRKLGVPSVRMSDTSVFNSPEADDLSLLLAAVAEPGDSGRLKTALATDLMGLDGNEIFKLQSGEDGSEAKWEKWIVRFRDWRVLWEESGFIHMLLKVMRHEPEGRTKSVMVRLMGLTDGERRLTNFLHLAELLQAATMNEHLGVEGLIRWLDQQRASQAETQDAAQLRLESDDNAVKLVTIFKAKGLEYPVVYCPYFWDGNLRTSSGKEPSPYHDPDDDYKAKLDIGLDLKAHREIEKMEVMAENMRLLYVGLTRAKHLCVVTWGYFTSAESSPLGYLLFCPKNPADIKAVKAHIKGQDDDQMIEELKALEEASNGAVQVRPVDLSPGKKSRLDLEAEEGGGLECRVPERMLRRVIRSFSYSGILSAQRGSTTTQRPAQYSENLRGPRRFSGSVVQKIVNPDQEQGRDRDEAEEEAASRVKPEQAGRERIPLADLVRGGRMGSLMHAVFEDLEFTFKDRKDLEKIAEEQIKAFGFDPKKLQEIVCKAVEDTLDTCYDREHPGFKLRNLPAKEALRELHFWYPADYDGRPISEIFEKNPSPSMPPDYPKKLAALDMSKLCGFLQGYIDLVYEHAGRWYVLDYKSNHLGERFADYADFGMQREMAKHHYYLQYHLYTLALHRYLKYRLTDYDYDRHMGGVFYLFLRGLSPDKGSKYGVFRDKPSRELIEALDETLGSPAGEVAS